MARCVRGSFILIVRLIVCTVVFLHHWLSELYAIDLHKPGLYRGGRAWANAWDLFRRKSPRARGSRRVAVDVVVGFECGGISLLFSFVSCERVKNTHGTRPTTCISYCETIKTRVNNDWQNAQHKDYTTIASILKWNSNEIILVLVYTKYTNKLCGHKLQ